MYCHLSESKDGQKPKGHRGAKNSETAAKVALMKLKQHATGDKGLPQVHILNIFIFTFRHLFNNTVAVFRQREPIFKCISPKNLKILANPCSSVPNGA